MKRKKIIGTVVALVAASALTLSAVADVRLTDYNEDGNLDIIDGVLAKEDALLGGSAESVSDYATYLLGLDKASSGEEQAYLNVIKGGTFDEASKMWGTYSEPGGKGVISYKDGQLVFDISSIGAVNYSPQLYYTALPMYKNGTYRLRFDISCTEDRIVEAMVQENGGVYTSYVWKELSLTSEPQTVDVTFQMEYDNDETARLVFNCGKEIGTDELGQHQIMLDNVYLELIDDTGVEYPEGAIVKNIIVNQVGYKTDARKVAVFRGENIDSKFSVVNAETGKTVYTGDITDQMENTTADEFDSYGDFSSVTTPGKYYVKTAFLGESYPFTISDTVYDDMRKDLVRMLYLQRCGCEVEDETFGHDACHTSIATIYGTSDKIDVSGGWHDAGDYGRYIVPAAKTVADLMLAYGENPELYGDDLNIPESGNGIPDILDEVRYELEWMLKMQNTENGGVYHKVSCSNFCGFVMPEKETGALIVCPISTTATADFCASMAMAYDYYKGIDSSFADKCLSAAESAWGFLEENGAILFTNPSTILTGEYGDKNDKDERCWAAAQMFKATGEEKYHTAFKSSVAYASAVFDWATVGGYASIAYLESDSTLVDATTYAKVKKTILDKAAYFAKISDGHGYEISTNTYNWGSNMTVANNGFLLYYANKISPNKAYTDAAQEHVNYLLGKNPLVTCFVSGYGTLRMENPHHRPSGFLKKAMPGMLSGGPNAGLEDDVAKGLLADAPPAKCYIDNTESYSTNEITIYWNSPFVYLLSF